MLLGILQGTGQHPYVWVLGCMCLQISGRLLCEFIALGQGKGPCCDSAGSHQPDPTLVEGDRLGLVVLIGYSS